MPPTVFVSIVSIPNIFEWKDSMDLGGEFHQTVLEIYAKFFSKGGRDFSVWVIVIVRRHIQ